MKKNVFICLFLLSQITLFSQTIDSLLDGQTLFLLSPNGRYAAGCGDGTPSYFYDLQQHQFLYQLPPDGAYYTNQINDLGQVAGAYSLQAAIWHQGGEWELLPKPDNLTDKQLAWSQANAISADGNTIVVSFGETPDMHCIYQKQSDGSYVITPLDLPTIEPIYHKAPQFVSIKGISADGHRIAARYLDDDGFRDIPMIFERNDEGSWSYRFLAIDTLLIDGCVLPHKPKREEVDNYSEALNEYWTEVMAMENGIYYELSNMGISANGKYINLSVAISIDEDDYYTITYPGVIDIDNDSLIIFNKQSGSCASVTDDGVISIATMTQSGIRTSYVSFLNNIDSIVTFGDYVNTRTNGKIDLSEIMVYQIDNWGTTDIGYGSAVFSSSGNAALSMQLNDWEWKYETYLIQFVTETSVDVVEKELFIVCPNPTRGLLYLNSEIDKIEVYDSSGRKILMQENISNVLDLSNLSRGIYMLKMTKDTTTYMQKIVIAK